MPRASVLCVVCLFSSVMLTVDRASAQSLGTFRWQLQPFCNVVTVAVTQSGNVFRLEGTDDQCGAGGTPASAIGTAFLNADGSVALGFTIVGAPGAGPTHVMARIDVATLGGTWHDSGGNTGALVLTSGTESGSPRPATATIGAVAVNPSQVQLRVSGSCSVGQVMRAVNENGTVGCVAGATGDITRVSAGDGIEGGGVSGDVLVALATNAAGAYKFDNDSGFVSRPIGNVKPPPISGAGRRLVYASAKSAFRVGEVNGTQWDDGNVGPSSVAMGRNTIASGQQSFAMGKDVAAGGFSSVALGTSVSASTDGTFMFGDASNTTDMLTFVPNQFLVRASGGTAFYSNRALTTGVELAAGAGAWANASDVNLKQQFRDLDGDEVLRKLAEMPIREWSYKAQDAAIRHVGPTAQDFRAAFGLGESPLKISTVDADGIALRAIQALAARTGELTDRVAEVETLKLEMAALRAELAALRETRR